MAAGTVLVVDCHRETISFAVAALAHAGFRVLTAESAEEGLGILTSHTDVDVVVSEVLMPAGISGLDLVRKVKQSFPPTAAMLMSGFADHVLDPGIPFLEKPFVASALVGRVERVLAEHKLQADKLRERCQTLQKTFERNTGLKAGMASVVAESKRARKQSRSRRADWLRTRLQDVNVVKPIVIVADGDQDERMMVCRYLTQTGLPVLEASSGAEALNLAHEYGSRVLLLVADVELTGQLVVELPQMDMIFIGGEGVHSLRPTIRRPFDPEDLLAVVASKLLQSMRSPGQSS